jgi:hypothetical protein
VGARRLPERGDREAHLLAEAELPDQDIGRARVSFMGPAGGGPQQGRLWASAVVELLALSCALGPQPIEFLPLGLVQVA